MVFGVRKIVPKSKPYVYALHWAVRNHSKYSRTTYMLLNCRMFVSVFIIFTCIKVLCSRYLIWYGPPFIHSFILLFFLPRIVLSLSLFLVIFPSISFRFSFYFYIFPLIAKSCFSFRLNFQMFLIVSHLHTSSLMAYGIVSVENMKMIVPISSHTFWVPI